MIDRSEFKRLLRDPAARSDIDDLKAELMASATRLKANPEDREQALHTLWGLERLLAKFAANN